MVTSVGKIQKMRNSDKKLTILRNLSFLYKLLTKNGYINLSDLRIVI